MNDGTQEKNSVVGLGLGIVGVVALLGALIMLFAEIASGTRVAGSNPRPQQPRPIIASTEDAREASSGDAAGKMDAKPAGHVAVQEAKPLAPAPTPVPVTPPPAPPTPAPTPPATTPAAPAPVAEVATVKLGEETYNTFCLACHQAEGKGKVGFAPYIRNSDFLALASDDFLRQTIIQGRPGTAMVPWAHLGPAKVDSLVLYLRAVTDPDAKPVATVDPAREHPGDPAAGSELYVRYCAACHGANANGYAEGGPGPAIGNPAFLAAASDDFLFLTIKHGRRGTPMMGFSGSRGLANLADAEIGHVIAYLRDQSGTEAPAPTAAKADPKAGKMHFDANCAACHQPNGTGRPGFAPSIRNRDFLAIASDEFIKETVHKGRPGTAMVQRPDLSDQVLDDIIAYLRSLEVGNAVTITVDASKQLASRGDKAAGHGKYGLYCAACHGPDGKGYIQGGSGPGIGMAGFLEAASDDYIFQTLKQGRIGTAMRPFLGARGLANLSEQDAFDIISYLRSLGATQ